MKLNRIVMVILALPFRILSDACLLISWQLVGERGESFLAFQMREIERR